MDQAKTPSSPVDASSFAYVVGIDMGSEHCSFCTLKPDKSQVIKPTEFANAIAGFSLLQEHLERLGVAPGQVLIGLEATSRYGENLYRFLEQHGYQLCLLHPRQTHQFARTSGIPCENRSARCHDHRARALEWRGSPRVCPDRADCHLPGVSAAAQPAQR